MRGRNFGERRGVSVALSGEWKHFCGLTQVQLAINTIRTLSIDAVQQILGIEFNFLHSASYGCSEPGVVKPKS